MNDFGGVNMKKVVALFLCVVMMMSLCACDLFSSGIKITKENYETYLHTAKALNAWLEILFPYILKDLGASRV